MIGSSAGKQCTRLHRLDGLLRGTADPVACMVGFAGDSLLEDILKWRGNKVRNQKLINVSAEAVQSLGEVDTMKQLMHWSTETSKALRKQRNAFMHALERGGAIHGMQSYQHGIDRLLDVCVSTELTVNLVGSCAEFHEKSGDASSILSGFRIDDVGALIADAASEIAALCVEKNGIAPDTSILVCEQNSKLEAYIPPDIFGFVLQEVLKNAFAATIERYGPLGIEDAPSAVVVELQSCKVNASALGSISIIDRGKGMSKDDVLMSQSWLKSSHEDREPNYHYSRDFGVKFKGQGIGLPRSIAMMDYFGWNASISSSPFQLGEGLPGRSDCANTVVHFSLRK